jgi:3-phosphoshikimate 1-carboxyvinyltransferase
LRVEWLGADVRVCPTGPIHGQVRPPGSKSLTNRYLTCAALADGTSRLHGASASVDTARLVAGLRQLGIEAEVLENLQRINVRGARGHLPADRAEIDVGNAGTAMRFLTALATLGRGVYRLDGSERMRQRPIGPLVGALQDLGADISYDHMGGYPPLTVGAGGLSGGQVRINAPESSQFVSALLMVAPYAAGDVFIAVDGKLPSQPYVEMTIALMRSMGAEVLSAEGRRFVVAAGQRYHGGEYEIEADASAATYFWAAAAVSGGCVRVRGVGRASRQGDVAFVDVLEQMGCLVRAGDDFLEVQGPSNGQLRGISIDLNDMPDTVQTLAVVALFAAGATEIRNVANLRIKETDRLAALAAELTRLGAQVEVRPDGLTVFPPATLTPATIETYDDHRMAMSFAVAGLASAGVVIRNAGCVAKSYPDFFTALDRLA